MVHVSNAVTDMNIDVDGEELASEKDVQTELQLCESDGEKWQAGNGKEKDETSRSRKRAREVLSVGEQVPNGSSAPVKKVRTCYKKVTMTTVLGHRNAVLGREGEESEEVEEEGEEEQGERREGVTESFSVLG